MNFTTQLENMRDTIRDNGMTVQEFEDSIRLIQDKVRNNMDIDWADIIAQCNIPFVKDTVRKASSQALYGWVFMTEYLKLKQIVEENNDTSSIATAEELIENEQKRYRSSTALNKDGSICSDKLICLSEDEVKDTNCILQAHGYDSSQWELISAKHSMWNVYTKQCGVKELYSSKITVKPRSDISFEDIEKFYKHLCQSYRPSINVQPMPQNGSLMLEIPIVDLHFGKTTATAETMKPYNTETAKLYFDYIIDYCIEQVKNKDIDHIVFPIGNDFWHYDTFQCTTTAGTIQTTDRKSQNLFKESIELLIDGITRLSTIAPVKVFYVPGNHDFLTSYHGIMALWCYFHDNPNVIVDTSTTPRKYTRFGNTLIGYTHGDKEKKRISGLMQIEAREDWGQTRYHHWHLGHYHSNHGDEQNGVIITNLPSVTGADEWHDISGYVGATQECKCFLWDKNYGLENIININVDKVNDRIKDKVNGNL